mmetsp:Transcript_3059/g.5151  ORF Transcript_3059/g.5151 Transcript_3059/m.5151 type:complete len:167 (+) Transcript_3059:45-545(+)
MNKKGSAASTRYTHKDWYTGAERAQVYVRSRRIDYVKLGVHHFIAAKLIDGDDRDWRVYEWGTDYSTKYESARYKTSSILGKECCSLGVATLDQLNAACDIADARGPYSSDFNCNHWTQKVAECVGWDIEVHWNCDCVLSDFGKRIVPHNFEQTETGWRGEGCVIM